MVTSVSTNAELGTLVTRAVYTRDGQMDLVCVTDTKNGALFYRSQDFYYKGTLVGSFTDDTKYSGTIIFGKAPHPYVVNFVMDDRSHEITSASISGNAGILDTYECTNGIFFPADASLIAQQNAGTNRVPRTFTIHPGLEDQF
jgi:hypothetical protein